MCTQDKRSVHRTQACTHWTRGGETKNKTEKACFASASDFEGQVGRSGARMAF